MLTSPVYVNSDNTISMELTGEERPERVAYVKRMMIASHLESVLSGKEKNPNLNSDVSAAMYESSGMYRQVEACSELITSYRELQIGSTEKLNKLISDYEEQEVDLDLTDMHKEGSFYSFKSAYGDGYNLTKHKYEMYSVKGQSHLFLDRLIAGSRMMEYMGLGKDVLKSDLVYIKDNKGEFNFGRKWYQKLGQYGCRHRQRGKKL